MLSHEKGVTVEFDREASVISWRVRRRKAAGHRSGSFSNFVNIVMWNMSSRLLVLRNCLRLCG